MPKKITTSVLVLIISMSFLQSPLAVAKSKVAGSIHAERNVSIGELGTSHRLIKSVATTTNAQPVQLAWGHKKIYKKAKKGAKKTYKGGKKVAKGVKNELKRMVLVCHGDPVCQAKIKLYQSYMLQLRTNATHYKLPQTYQVLLARYYPELKNLRGYQFAHARRQPKDNATTDCSKTYYSDKGMVKRLQLGALRKNEFHLLLHELHHYNQCKRIGGRDQYAKLWFRDLKISVIKGNIKAKKLHDNMPMEKEASNVSARICRQLPSRCTVY